MPAMADNLIRSCRLRSKAGCERGWNLSQDNPLDQSHNEKRIGRQNIRKAPTYEVI